MVLISAKIAVFNPIPSASDNAATIVKTGFFASIRNPNTMSCQRTFMLQHLGPFLDGPGANRYRRACLKNRTSERAAAKSPGRNNRNWTVSGEANKRNSRSPSDQTAAEGLVSQLKSSVEMWASEEQQCQVE